MYLNYFILFSFILNFLTLIILFFISVFLVRFRIYLTNFLNETKSYKSNSEIKELKDLGQNKTWDQKYEDDLEAINKRIRQSAGEL